jgi:hypothetical protein
LALRRKHRRVGLDHRSGHFGRDEVAGPHSGPYGRGAIPSGPLCGPRAPAATTIKAAA